MRDNDPLRLAPGSQAPGREVSEGVVGYLLESSHGPVYRFLCVGLAVGAAVVGLLVLVSAAAPPKAPIIYRYQWPGQFGDQQMTICTRVENEDEHECPRAYTSSEL